jgi:hypothetical protein
MNESIIAEIDVEILRFKQVRALLANEGPKRGRPATKTAAKADQSSGRKKRVVSPATKERMRLGQLKRWAAAKKLAKPKANEVPRSKSMAGESTPAGQ